MKNKKIIIITGEMGVGKTEFCLNYLQKKEGKKYLIDLDVINPYFRSREHELFLKEHNIKLLGSYLVANTTLDVPAISADVKIPFFDNDNLTAIYDLAGTDKGLNSLVFMKDEIEKNIDDIEFLVVLNIARLGDDLEKEIISFIKKVQVKTNLKVTGVIHNSHLMEYTTKEYYLEADKKVESILKDLGIEIKYRLFDAKLGIDPSIFENEVVLIEDSFGKRTW
jgi:MinD-like ATPase involved in chromosome partitioning or flagellar assembly